MSLNDGEEGVSVQYETEGLQGEEEDMPNLALRCYWRLRAVFQF